MSQDFNSLFYNNSYTLKKFYDDNPEFNYYLYRHSKSEKVEGLTEKEVIDYWFYKDKGFDFSKIPNFILNNKDVIIFPHLGFSNIDGGTIVQYLLAEQLDKMGVRTRIINTKDNNASNSKYNNFYEGDFDINKTVVIYCEGVEGNPLNAKYVARWMLSELGRNVPYSRVYTWNKNELVYFFNSEVRFFHEKNTDDKFKLLTIFYLDNRIRNYNFGTRQCSCFTIRKSINYRTEFNNFHQENSIEILRGTTFEEYIDIFNKCEIFYCYDPLTFLQIISILSGCVAVVYPLVNVSKNKWYQKTGLYEYMKYKNITDIGGIAYGNSEEEIVRAKSTIHLAIYQIKEIQQWNKDTQLKSFIQDINNWEINKNTIENIYLNRIDYEFYENFHLDIKGQGWNKDQLKNHYENYGFLEERQICEQDFYSMYPDFEYEFYENFHSDIKPQKWNKYELMGHYYHFGNKEGRQICEQDFYSIYPNFDYEFYENFYSGIKAQGWNKYQLMGHYYRDGVTEGRIICEEKKEK